MIDAPEVQSCRYCHQPIPTGAKRCHSCGSWQSWLFPDATRPVGRILLFFTYTCITVAAIILIYYTDQKQTSIKEQREYAIQPFNALTVESVSLSFVKQGEYTWVGVMGQLKNTSGFMWKDPYIHVSIYNKDKKLIDSNYTCETGLVLAPDTTTAFRFLWTPLASEEQYSIVRASVRWATKVPKDS